MVEYICTIYKHAPKTFWLQHCACLELPELRLKNQLVPVTEGKSYLVFCKEDRYSPNLISVQPPKELTEEQLELITKKWNECVENNLEELSFEL